MVNNVVSRNLVVATKSAIGNRHERMAAIPPLVTSNILYLISLFQGPKPSLSGSMERFIAFGSQAKGPNGGFLKSSC